ncbi:alpha-amylase family glycosyl hydrolase, partial [Streptomyces beijiangensis]|uniref:alpha-amylase family glycosyl hydrolase n=1 Tax=Streptomyces beijiangensis TaxID=163361 RepID=UPI003FD6CAB7
MHNGDDAVGPGARGLRTHRQVDAVSPKHIDTDRWWRDAVIYQVYVRSFLDSTGDGIGDLAGVRAGLPYLK